MILRFRRKMVFETGFVKVFFYISAKWQAFLQGQICPYSHSEYENGCKRQSNFLPFTAIFAERSFSLFVFVRPSVPRS